MDNRVGRKTFDELWAKYIALKTKCELFERKVNLYETWIGESSLGTPQNEIYKNRIYCEDVAFPKEVVEKMREICRMQEET